MNTKNPIANVPTILVTVRIIVIVRLWARLSSSQVSINSFDFVSLLLLVHLNLLTLWFSGTVSWFNVGKSIENLKSCLNIFSLFNYRLAMNSLISNITYVRITVFIQQLDLFALLFLWCKMVNHWWVISCTKVLWYIICLYYDRILHTQSAYSLWNTYRNQYLQYFLPHLVRFSFFPLVSRSY